MHHLCVRLSGVILFIALSFNGWTSEIQCQDGKVCRIVSTSLPLRALPRDLSIVYSEPDISSKVLIQNIKAFEPLYVFERKNVDLSEGWYQVGKKVKEPLGWIQAKDILEWKHALVVSFTPDEQRHQVLMFKTKDALKQLLEAPDRQERVQAIYAGLKAIPPQVPEGIISVEPTRFVNIEEVFYLLAVLDFEQVDKKTRILQIASAVPGSRADENFPDIVENPIFMAQAMLGSQLVEDNKIAQLAAILASSKKAMLPRDITAWVLERDLINPNLRALEVGVLLTRTDMNNLIQALDSLLHQIKQSIVTPMEFFIGLQAVVTMALQDQEITLKAAQRVADAGLLQAWLDSLPYKSAILKMRGEHFISLSKDERARFLKEIESKLEQSRALFENKALWVALDKQDSEQEYVYPLGLSALP
ncbi:MAG: hypothetical protein ABFS56_12815 [Pseudomonadota bacterium]